MIVGIVIQALYNVVALSRGRDTYGAETVEAIAGLSIAFPVQMIMLWKFFLGQEVHYRLTCP
jgi:hypothetical protein